MEILSRLAKQLHHYYRGRNRYSLSKNLFHIRIVRVINRIVVRRSWPYPRHEYGPLICMFVHGRVDEQ